MEPFALFNLLKSFLPQTENSTEKPTSEKKNNDTNIDPSNEFSTQSNQTQNGEFPNPPSNYCLDFIRRHEERAGRKR